MVRALHLVRAKIKSNSIFYNELRQTEFVHPALLVPYRWPLFWGPATHFISTRKHWSSDLLQGCYKLVLPSEADWPVGLTGDCQVGSRFLGPFRAFEVRIRVNGRSEATGCPFPPNHISFLRWPICPGLLHKLQSCSKLVTS